MMDLAFTNDPYDTDLDELKRRYMLAQELANPKGVSPIAGALFKIFQKPKTDAIEAEFRDLNARRQSERQDSLRKIAEVIAGPKREVPYVPASMPQVDDEGYQQPGTMADTMQKNAAAQQAFGDKRTRIAQELLMSKFPDIQQHGMKLMEKQGPAKLTYQNLGDRTIGVDEMGNIANTYQHGVSPNTVYDKTRVSAGTQFTHTTPSADAMMRHGSMSADQKADLQAKIADMVDRGVAVPPDLFRSAYGGTQSAPVPQPAQQPMLQGVPPTGIPPEVLAAAQAGKPFHMTQAPGQTPVNQPLPPQLSPADQRKVQADIAKKFAEAKMGNEKMYAQIMPQIDRAKELLKDATGSWIGSGADVAMNVVGASTSGSRSARALETLGGWMTSNVPRMEGPQSDNDTKLYRQMAALVGDRMVPNAERLEALKTLEGIMEAYKNGFSDTGYRIPQRKLSIEDRLKKYGKPG